MKASVVLFAMLLSFTLTAEDKIAIPSSDDLKNAAKEIHKQYEDDFAKTAADEKLALAEKLLKRAELTTEKAADRYALFCEVMTLAAGELQRSDAKHIYMRAVGGRGKNFAPLESATGDNSVAVALTKDGIYRYDGVDYSTIDKLVEALKKNANYLDCVVVTIDKEAPKKQAAGIIKAMAEAGFSRALFKTGSSKPLSIDDVLLRPGVLELALNEGLALIAADKIPEAMNEIRAGINCGAYDRRLVSAVGLETLSEKIAAEKDGKRKAALLVYRAVVLLSDVKHQGNAEKAVEVLNDAEAADANLPEIYNTRGICWMSLKQGDKALSDFEKALTLNPEYPDAIENRARASAGLGKKDVPLSEKEEFDRQRKRLDGKIAEFTEAVRLRPDFYRFWIVKAGLLHQRGRLEQALSDLDSADKLAPNSFDVLTERCSIYFQMGKLDLALENGKLALEQKADSEHVACLCGMICGEQGEFDQALKNYAVALAPGGRHPEIVLTDRAFVYFYKGDLDRAIEDCTEALKKDETCISALHLRARIYLVQGKTAEASADFQTIIKSAARSAHEWAVMACARAATGDFDGALRILNLVRDLRPADRWVDFNGAAIYCMRAASAGSKTKDDDISEAMKLLNEAAKDGMKNWTEVQKFPEIKPLLDDVRFQELVKKK